jgi:hypothetical protein
MSKCQKHFKMKKRVNPIIIIIKTQTYIANSKVHITKNLNQLIKMKILKEMYRQETHLGLQMGSGD